MNSHTHSTQMVMDLKGRGVTLAVTEDLEGAIGFPFVHSFAAFKECIEVLPNAELGAAVFEEALVQCFFQVLL